MRRAKLVICTSALVLCAGYAGAQTPPPPDTFKVDYFSYGNTPPYDATLRLTNAGTAGGSLCAAVYVFSPDQEVSECCACYLTPDGLRPLSVNHDLLANPLQGNDLSMGSIRVVSTTARGSGCATYPTNLTPTAGVRAWATHLQQWGILTETPSQSATLSIAEIRRLQTECYAIQVDGSGTGLCTCGTGD